MVTISNQWNISDHYKSIKSTLSCDETKRNLMKSCDQPDLENPRYTCHSVAEDGFDQCLKHRHEYIKALELQVEELEKKLGEYKEKAWMYDQLNK